MPKKKIKYLTHNVKRSYNEELELFKHKFVTAESSFVKRYKNCFFLLSQLSKSERLLLDYLTEVMDDDNFIANNKTTRDNFNALLRQFNIDEYKESTIHKCFSKLCKVGFIEDYKGKRGMYQVNPLYYHSDKSCKDRERLIREILEKPNKEPINKYRHKILSKKNFPKK